MKKNSPIGGLVAFGNRSECNGAAQAVPDDYQQVLKIVGKSGDLQGECLEGQHPSQRHSRHHRQSRRADALRLRRLVRHDERRAAATTS